MEKNLQLIKIEQFKKYYIESKGKYFKITKKFKIKFLFLFLFILCCYIDILKFKINILFFKQMNEDKNNENSYRRDDMNMYNFFLSLKNISYDNITLLKEYRDQILEVFSKNVKKNITSVENLYIDEELKYGNQLLLINKVIFFCQIIKCKKILLSPYTHVHIKNKIIDKKFNITIERYNNSGEKEILFHYLPFPYYYFLQYKIENKFYIFKDEILKNLPQINVDPNDLYIHIRGDDVFLNPKAGPPYAQPPFCFYKRLIDNFDFNNIYIVSTDKLNPIIDVLIKSYSNVKYMNNSSLEKDIAYLTHAYNIVGSVSSFLIGLIKLNNNLKNFFEYDLYQLKERVYHLHHSIYNYKRNYTIFQMSSSKNYKKYMFIWKANRKQIYILLKDKYLKKFKIINNNN